MNQKIISLEDIKIVRHENIESNDKEFYKDSLNLKISTWMKFYANLETPNSRAKMRDVCISSAEAIRKDKVVVREHGAFASKFTSSYPYYFFLSVVTEIEDTHDQINSVIFHEIIDYTLGEIVDSFHTNEKVELSWIVTEYMLAAQIPKMTIFCSECIDAEIQYDFPFDIDLVNIDMPVSGRHKSKVSILKYSDNKIRIIVSTADSTYLDWKYYSQGLWVSPLLPPLPDNADPSDGESITNFKNDFISYLSAYNQPETFGWEALVQRTDCSAINVVFIASVPGEHKGVDLDLWGHTRLGKVLSNHFTGSSDLQNWPVVAQTVVVGVFGSSYKKWVQSNIVLSMSKEKNKRVILLPDFNLIYPTQENFNKSPCSRTNPYLMHLKNNYLQQKWTKDYLYHWKSEQRGRTLAMPHTKTYTRLSPDGTEISWFFLTSCDITRYGWGRLLTIDEQLILSIGNYEAGVLFIPELIINKATFPIKESESPDVPVFLLPYDVPLTSYEPDEEPYLRDDIVI